MVEQLFGSCCDELKRALTAAPENTSMFSVDGGGLYLTVGLLPHATGTASFGMAVLFCPFCGVALQTREVLKRRH